MNCTSIGAKDFLYLSPNRDLDKNPLLLIDDANK